MQKEMGRMTCMTGKGGVAGETANTERIGGRAGRKELRLQRVTHVPPKLSKGAQAYGQEARWRAQIDAAASFWLAFFVLHHFVVYCSLPSNAHLSSLLSRVA